MDEIEEDERLRSVPELGVESEHLRLGPGGFRASFNVAVKWRLTDEEALELLALGTGTPVEQLKLNPAPQLFTEERMLQISYLNGINKGLHICHGDDLAS